MSALRRERTLESLDSSPGLLHCMSPLWVKSGHSAILAKLVETHADHPHPPSYAARMDDDREVYEFSHALYLARQGDRETAQMIVAVAEAGVDSDK